MKISYQRLSVIAMSAFMVLMAIVSVFLVMEYRFFKQAVQELAQVKSHYDSCIVALKRQLDSQDVIKPVILTEKKPEKKNEFLVVNRSGEYLKREALKFAKTHKLDQSLKKMYDNAPPVPSVKKAAVKPVAKKIVSSAPKASPRVRRSVHIKRVRRRKTTHHSPKKSVPLSEDEKIRYASFKKQAGFMWPVERADFWLSSRFGPRKNADGSQGFHSGIDLAAYRGTPIKAAASGIVAAAGYYKGYGNMVFILHGKGFKTRYAHMDTILVKAGQRVEQGQKIGTVGNTGHVRKTRGHSGDHLHFETYVPQNKRVNPLYLLD